jgi:translation initiation factor IF-2
MSKVRIYDLAKELKLDNKKVIEEVRRFGYDVSVPSNSVPPDIAEKVKSKYFPQKAQSERRVKLVKHRNEVVDSGNAIADLAPSDTAELVKGEIVTIEAQAEVAVESSGEDWAAAVATATTASPIAVSNAGSVSNEGAASRATSVVKVIKKPEKLPEEASTITPISEVVAQPATESITEQLPEALSVADSESTITGTATESRVDLAPEVLRTEAPTAEEIVKESRESVESKEKPEDPNKTRIVKIEAPRPEAKTGEKPAKENAWELEKAPDTTSRDSRSLPGKMPNRGMPLPPAGNNSRNEQIRGAKPVKTQIIPLSSARKPQPNNSLPPTRRDTPPMPPRNAAPERSAPPGAANRPANNPANNARPVAQVIHRISAQSEIEPLEAPRTTYVPPPDNRKKGRRGQPQPVGRPGHVHNKREDKEKLPTVPIANLPVVKNNAPPVPQELRPIRLVEGCTVKEFAETLEVKPKDVVALLLNKGVMATINQTLNADVVREIGREFGYTINFTAFEEMTADSENEDASEQEDIEERAPVVTVMGHVDHGKTSLLDAIRKTRVAEGEAGGITQHIGAYSVEVPDPDDPERRRRIVFLDTPGHEAFTMMRARGAKATDVVVLVVAADDGVMPQTVEAIEHAKAAGVPIVVAINKIDKPHAQPDRIKQSLSDYGLVWDGWGGDTVMVEVSAKQRINLTNLLEMIILTSDILELKANPKRLGNGVVLEAKLDKGRGAVATVLVQNGTLRVGDPVIAGLFFGRVRAMFGDRGQAVQEAGPVIPVEVLGLQGVPAAGDQFQVVTDVAKAQQIANLRQSKRRMLELSRSSAQRLEDLFSAMQAGKLKELLVILKTDVQGSVEVLKDTLHKLSTDKVKVRVIRSGVGAITESDVLLAAASNDMAHSAVIIGFNVRPEQRAEELARQENIDVRLHSIIYKVEEEIRNAMIGMLDATTKEVILGKAEIRQIIKIPKVGNIAGVMVIDGLIKRVAKVRLVRDSAVVYEGQISSLRRFKEDVSEVKQGFECGIGVDRFSDIKIGDILEVYITEKVMPTEL